MEHGLAVFDGGKSLISVQLTASLGLQLEIVTYIIELLVSRVSC